MLLWHDESTFQRWEIFHLMNSIPFGIVRADRESIDGKSWQNWCSIKTSLCLSCKCGCCINNYVTGSVTFEIKGKALCKSFLFFKSIQETNPVFLWRRGNVPLFPELSNPNSVTLTRFGWFSLNSSQKRGHNKRLCARLCPDRYEFIGFLQKVHSLRIEHCGQMLECWLCYLGHHVLGRW